MPPAESMSTQKRSFEMDVKALMATAAAMVDGDRGILAMDESTPTCDKRFAQYHKIGCI